MSKAILSVGVILMTSATLTAAPPVVEKYERWAQAIAPKDAELKWRRIPWLTNLSEGVYHAARENRPLLVWASGDAPLERC